MNREGILVRSRNEGKGMDIVGLQSLEKASRTTTQAGMLLCYFTAVVEVTITGQVGMESWLIYFDILNTPFLMEYRPMKRRHELSLSIFHTALFLTFPALSLWKPLC